MNRVLCALAAFASATFSPFALYRAVFWAWVTATPLTDGQRVRAQCNASAWFWLFVGTVLATIILAYCAVGRASCKRIRQNSGRLNSGELRYPKTHM